MVSLVGYTGFVGSNIYAAAGKEIDAVYNSKNVGEAYGTSPDLLIYAGVRAEKYLANNNPKKDMEIILQAEENIAKISPKKLVLISTIDVFKTPKDVDENSKVDIEGLHAYGYNRYQLELWAREQYPDSTIIRLPGLFGKNIKKNFIYDYMNSIPYMLKPGKFEELSYRDPEIRKYYVLQENDFYRLHIHYEDIVFLKEKFKKLGFSALNFTDSRSKFQFYNLERLWGDIQIVLGAGIKLWHPATEPVFAGEVYKFLTGEPFINELGGTPADYDYKTTYYELFNGKEGYICCRDRVLEEIKLFVGMETDR